MPEVTPRLKTTKKKRGGPRRDKEVATAYHSLIVRARGFCEAGCGYVCECPEAPTKHLPPPLCKLQCAHIITRARAATRTDENNAFAMCASCHSHFTKEPVEFGMFVMEKIGHDGYQALYTKAQAGIQGTSLMFWRGERARLTEAYKRLCQEAA